MFNKILQIIKGNLLKIRQSLESYFFYKNKYSFLLPFILNKFDVQSVESDPTNTITDLYNLAVSFFILSLFVLFSFTNVVGYLTVIILRYKYDLNSKFPKFKWIFNYYEKTSYILILIEVIFCYIILIAMISLYLFLIIKFRELI